MLLPNHKGYRFSNEVMRQCLRPLNAKVWCNAQRKLALFIVEAVGYTWLQATNQLAQPCMCITKLPSIERGFSQSSLLPSSRAARVMAQIIPGDMQHMSISRASMSCARSLASILSDPGAAASVVSVEAILAEMSSPPSPQIERGTKRNPIRLSPAGKFQRLLDAADN